MHYTAAQKGADPQLWKEQIFEKTKLNANQLEVTDQYISQNVLHIYFKRKIAGLEVYNSYGAVHVAGAHHTMQYHNLLGYSPQMISNARAISGQQALINLAKKKRYRVRTSNSAQWQTASSLEQSDSIVESSISYNPIEIEALLYRTNKRELRHVWSIAIDEIKSDKWKNYMIDAESGEILDEIDWTISCEHAGHPKHKHDSNCSHHAHITKHSSMMTDSSYNIWNYPIESPNHGDRAVVARPWLNNSTASPMGWHRIGNTNFQVTKGNNVDAFLDADNSNTPTNGNADRADGGATLNFDFPWTADGDPTLYKDAAVTNLFYWNNLIHDVWFNYGFDEPSGNFQEENYTNTGNASDYVSAQAQDGSGTCNANFSTPPDGGNARMQMYNCGNQDGDFDNGVIVHEYGHGVSIRLTGGPSTSGCLGNQEQMGEGWSDWMALMMTISATSTGTDPRPIGTYLFDQPTTGAGIRPYPYTTDMSVNPMTYGYVDDANISVPHGVGSVWCTMLWDLTWAFIDEYGFDADLYQGSGGNNKVMQLVIEAMKLQPCSPGFVDGRDAIISADQMINNGDNLCLIWEVFAARGLGYSASQGSSNDKTDGVEAFDKPPVCTLALGKTADKTEANPGDIITYTLTATNNHSAVQNNLVIKDNIPANTTFLDATNGATLQMDTVVWNAGNMALGESKSFTFRATVDPNIDPVADDIFDNMESGTTNWTNTAAGQSSWTLQNAQAASASHSWFANDASSFGEAILVFSEPLGISNNTRLTFTHSYDTEALWDGGRVEISIDGGNTFQDLGPHFTTNGYNSTIFNSIPGFSGNSNGFITSVVDLSSFDGQVATIRFRMSCDAFVGGHGWYIDDVFVEGLSKYVPNVALAKTDEFSAVATLANPTKILVSAEDFVISGSHTNVSCHGAINGSATVSASGGSGNYTYMWSNGATIASQSALAAGMYYVDVSDGQYQRRKYFFIDQPNPLEISSEVENAIDGNNGSIAVEVSGGVMPYMYNWSNGATEASLNNIAAGTYSLTVTDANNCTVEQQFTVVDLIASCAEMAFLMEVQLDQRPNEISYMLLDAQGNTVASRNYNGVANGSLERDVFCLANGCYTLKLQDNYGDGLCSPISTPLGYVKLTRYDNAAELLNICEFGMYEFDFCVGPLSASATGVSPTCANHTDGTVTALPQAGTYIYQYSWSNNANTQTISNAGVGNYLVTVTDGESSVTTSYDLEYTRSKVTSDADSGVGTLRQILSNGCPQDTVTFDAGLIGDTIVLDSVIQIDKSVHIEGLGQWGTLISGQDMYRIFQIEANAILSLKSLTLMHAQSTSQGGAFYNLGTCRMQNLILRNNKEGVNPKSFTNDGSIIIKGIVDIRD